ncbi:hypothetical protein [Zoogloea sp.]|jgi:hypothetical protein|uniref:hypothetical protein n=1 Tax=Zoogloea sp. TaxID=49181 RepID=UPI0037D9E307
MGKLVVNVQVDRLPDVWVTEDGSDRDLIQIGLRISAAIEESAQISDMCRVLPWKWKADSANPICGSWSIHKQENWTLWSLDGGNQLKEIDKKCWWMESLDPSVGQNWVFRNRIDCEVAAILSQSGAGAFALPGAGGVALGRSVFGLTESLTGLPHPVPAAMQIWTAISIDKKCVIESFGLDDSCRFWAVPNFVAPSGTTYSVPSPISPPSSADPWPVDYNTTNQAEPASAKVYASLPIDDLVIGKNDPQRLIDLSTLLIHKGSVPEFEGADWMTTLPQRIAEAIDPAARAIALLDKVIRDVVSEEETKGSSATRDAIRKDMIREDIIPRAADDSLRKFLAELHRPVLAPRAHSSRPSAAPAAAFLERLATSNPSLWSTVAPLLLAHAGAEGVVVSGLKMPNVVSRTRLATAAGITPGREEELADPQGSTSIDNEQAFGDWLFEHWNWKEESTSAPVQALNLFGKAGHFKIAANTVTSQEVDVGVVDLVRALDINGSNNGRKIAIGFSFKEVSAIQNGSSADAVFTLSAGNGPGFKGPRFEFSLKLEPHQITLTTKGGSKVFPGVLTEDPLTVEIKSVGNVVLLSVRYQNCSEDFNIDEVARSGRIGITAEVDSPLEVSFFGPAGLPANVLRGALAGPSAVQALRGALSLAHAGPAIAGLMGGWVPISGASVNPAARTQSLRERLVDTMEAYVDSAFDDAFGQAKTDANVAFPSEIDSLIKRLCEAAKADAKRLAAELVPRATSRNADPVTEDAPPLTFVFDQLQDFDDSVDLWARLAGLGILIGRSDDSKKTPDEWWSLNVATLHQPRVAENGSTELLDEDNSVNVGDGEWPKSALVDPVPLVVTEISGVRNAVIRYESQSLVAQMEGRPHLGQSGSVPRFARRPEAYFFPLHQHFPKLPPLTFGRTYHVIPYLIGHGGVIPPALRANVANPTSSFMRTLAPGGWIEIKRDLIGDDVIRSKTYLRTVPVGAPRLSPASVWPGVFDGVAPLAQELPDRAPPITLIANKPVYFFLDKAQTRGTLNAPYDNDVGVRIEIAALDLNNVSGQKLRVVAEEIDPAALTGVNATLIDLTVSLQAVLDVCKPAVGGLRIEIVDTSVTVSALKSLDDALAEDEPEPKDISQLAQVKGKIVPVKDWRSVALKLEALGGDFDVEPPSICWGVHRHTQNSSGTQSLDLIPDGDKPFFPPEFGSQSRNITVLDGIGGAPAGPVKAKVALRLPSVSLATYDRWINGPIAGFGTAGMDPVVTALNEAAKYITNKPTKGSDRVLDDPAVEGIALEVVCVFPKRCVDVPISLIERSSQLKRDHAKDIVEFGVELKSEVLNGTAEWIAGSRQLKLVRGCIYELRLYGLVPIRQNTLAPLSTADRFASAATAGWRKAKVKAGDKDEEWHLGAPLVLCVEVASGIMPELYIADFNNPPFKVNLKRPPEVHHERAVIHLLPYSIKCRGYEASKPGSVEQYASLRFVDSVALFDQRWSWRGRPQPEIPSASGQFGHGGIFSQGIAEFADMALLGRADDDIGPIHEMRMGRAHVYASRSRFFADEKETVSPPVLLERDLDYRGGANLWRFALRIRSRYAAMRPNDARLIAFTHRLLDKQAKTAWWPLVVPDRVGKESSLRQPMRPGFMIVLPLTEPLMASGSVPPLLVLFNEPMFPLFHVGDGIEAAIELARHPFIDSGEGQPPPVKYWPEFAPDPIRTGEGASGRPLALRCDGPVGYTFDVETDAGRFDHAGFLISPVAEEVRPWSLVKLRFRRLEAPELLLDERNQSKVVSGDGWKEFSLQVDIGLAIDLAELKPGTPLKLRLSFDKNRTPDPSSFVNLEAHIDDSDPLRPRVVLNASTHRGSTQDWSASYDTGCRVQIRVIASQRPKPNSKGKDIPSVGDVSVRVRIVRDSSFDVMQKPYENVWLSVLCLPLNTNGHDSDLYLKVENGVEVTERPVRLSDFTPAVWCQFAAAMSQFVVEAEIKKTDVSPRTILDEKISVTQLMVSKKGEQLCLGLADLHPGESVARIALRTAFGANPDAQVEERLYALVTRYVYDAFDRLRERPIAVYRLSDTLADPTLTEKTWPPSDLGAPFSNSRGRLRIVRVLRGRKEKEGGFERKAREFPGDFFGDKSDGVSGEPLDAAGQVIGISAPIEWGR